VQKHCFFVFFLRIPVLFKGFTIYLLILLGENMKLLTIVIKPSRSDGVRRALSTIGIGGATIISAQGFGTQKGHSETYRGASYEVKTKPKTMFQVACKDDDVENVIKAVREVANTNEIGDGKIFITELNDVVRIRTGETGEDAITENNNE
jgi:nitrogen regulatory protein P-II 2